MTTLPKIAKIEIIDTRDGRKSVLNNSNNTLKLVGDSGPLEEFMKLQQTKALATKMLEKLPKQPKEREKKKFKKINTIKQFLKTV